jgi:benzoylformate decarboxylase
MEKWPVRRYFLTGSAILGWGLPAAVGVSLGLAQSPVVALIGDGSSLYSPQGLWSVAKYKISVTFIVMNNAEYNILKKYAAAQGSNASGNFEIPGLEISNPSIDFVALAASLGINACRVTRASDIGEAVAAGVASNEPNLIEIIIGVD